MSGRGDDDRPERVRQDLGQDDAGVAHADHEPGLHELPPAQRQELRPDQPRDRGPGRRARSRSTMVSAEGVRIATSTIARMKGGIVWNISVTRIRMSSTRPP